MAQSRRSWRRPRATSSSSCCRTSRRITSATSSSWRARALTTARRSTASMRIGHHPGRRSAVEGSGEGEAVRDGRARRAERRVQRRTPTPAARSRPCCSPDGRTAAARSSSSCVTDQLALDGQYTVFGRVAKGMDVVQKISEAPASTRKGAPPSASRSRAVTIRDTPPPEPMPFATETVERAGEATAPCSKRQPGEITIEFLPDKAPEHVRNFLRLGAGRRLRRHGLSPRRPRVRDPGRACCPRAAPLTQKQQAYVHTLQPEFNDTKHVEGTVSMARGDDPASATTSFFIVTGDAPARSTASTRHSAGRRRHGGGGRDGPGAGKRRDPGGADRADAGSALVRLPPWPLWPRSPSSSA